jgi:hypothetical protein
MAEGTAAGTTVTNNVSLTYRVGGVDQNAVTASNSFVVDRKVNLVVAEVGNATTSVSPGQVNAVTAFDVTNSSNAPLDLGLAATQLSGGTAKHGGTDNFNLADVKIFGDTNGNGSFGCRHRPRDLPIDQVPADETRRVFFVATCRFGRSTAMSPGPPRPPPRRKRPRPVLRARP